MRNDHTRYPSPCRWLFAAAVLSSAAACGNEIDADLGEDEIVALDEPPSSATTANLLTNGSFENGISPWYLNVNDGAGTLVADGRTRAVGSTSARLRVTQSLGNVWDLAAVQPGLAVTGGQQHTVSFYAKASSSGRQLVVRVGQGYSPWSGYTTQTISLSKTWRRYSFTFTPPTSDSNAQVMFASGQSTGSMWLDAVSLTGELPAAGLTFSPASWDFGSVDVGSVSAGKTFTVTFSGSSNLVISDTVLSGDFTWVQTTPTTCVIGNANAPGSTCTMLVAFAPQSAGNLTGALTVTSNAPNSPLVIPLSGSGVSSDPAPSGGLITSFVTGLYQTFYIDGAGWGVHTAGNSYSFTNPDDHTLRMEIRQGDHPPYDSNSVERFSIQQAVNTAFGTPFAVNYEFMVEPGDPTPEGWFVTTQMHNADWDMPFSGGTSPPWAIEMGGDHLQVWMRWCAPGADPRNSSSALHNELLWKSPTTIVRGRYYNIRIESNAVNTSAGYMRVWVDGTQVVNYSGPVGYGYDTYMEAGLYRQTMPQTTAAVYRNLTVSK